MAKKKEIKEKIERSYNVPLRKEFREIVNYKKTPRAIRALRAFLIKHMKSENIKLGMHLNEHMWKHGAKNPPHHVKIHVIKETTKDGEEVRAELEGFEFKEAVKPGKKKEPETMKDKLEKKLGVTPEAEAKKEEKVAEKATETKAEEKHAAPAPATEKKEAPEKAKAPTAHELAAAKTN